VIAGGRIVATGTAATLGGRASRPATVTWLDGDARRSQTTAQPAAAVARLAARFGGEVPGLTVHRPSLEDVYLDLLVTPPPVHPGAVPALVGGGQ
jgi:ABC-2 type transport system ATP-binding protein